MGAAEQFITRTADAYVANKNDQVIYEATKSVVEVENARKGGGQGKGERKFTAKPSKLKGAKVLPDGRVQITDPRTGKKIIKSPGWSPD